MRLASLPPEVRLVNAFERPFDNAVAAARTCYAAKGIISPSDVAGDGIADEGERGAILQRRNALAESIYQAGHHTVFQHAHFQFAIDRISRHALWAFFHAHPFYNSEQVSQRYVKVRRGNSLVPELTRRAQAIYEECLAHQEQAYKALTESLMTPASEIFFGLFPARRRRADEWKREIRRKAQEAARYVLPVATWARLYHTISAITLLRYARMRRAFGVPREVSLVVDAMIELVVREDPDFERLVEEAIDPDGSAEATALPALDDAEAARRAQAFRGEFDAALEGRVSRLVGHSPAAEAAVASAVREVLGAPAGSLDDDEAIALAADPSRNRIHGESMNLTTLSPLTRALHHAHYTFRRKLSHTADSQDQRHRMVPGSRPLMEAHLAETPDVIHPALVEHDEASRRIFDESMARTWDAIAALRAEGAPAEAAVYLLPNAVSIRYTESSDFSALHHKHAMRLCYNAQEEIWRASVDEAQQISDVHPRLGRYLLPPCGLRILAGTKPYCPEGTRFCGVPVWKLNREDYRRVL